MMTAITVARITATAATEVTCSNRATGSPDPSLLAPTGDANALPSLCHYEAGGIPRPDLSHLYYAFIKKMREAGHLQLVIEALQRLVEQEIAGSPGKLRSTIKRLLAKYGYPPDAQPAVTDLVIREELRLILVLHKHSSQIRGFEGCGPRAAGPYGKCDPRPGRGVFGWANRDTPG
jgi:hypothetical protein